jgi:hypothetical protein
VIPFSSRMKPKSFKSPSFKLKIHKIQSNFN